MAGYPPHQQKVFQIYPLMLEAIQQHTQLTFSDSQWSKTDMPTKLLGTWPDLAFYYKESPWKGNPNEAYSMLIDSANSLLDFFPYNDRAAEATYLKSDEGAIQIQLEIEPFDEFDDVEEVLLTWLPFEEQAILIINHEGGDLLNILPTPLQFTAIKRKNIVLGDG